MNTLFKNSKTNILIEKKMMKYHDEKPAIK